MAAREASVHDQPSSVGLEMHKGHRHERSVKYSSDEGKVRNPQVITDNPLSYGNFQKSNCGTTSFD